MPRLPASFIPFHLVVVLADHRHEAASGHLKAGAAAVALAGVEVLPQVGRQLPLTLLQPGGVVAALLVLLLLLALQLGTDVGIPQLLRRLRSKENMQRGRIGKETPWLDRHRQLCPPPGTPTSLADT